MEFSSFMALEEAAVAPFYLNLMGVNILRAPERVLRRVQPLARQLSSFDVQRLLRAAWRPRVMGAWYAVADPRAEYADTVHQSLTTAAGSLTAPALLVAARVYARADTLDTIATYARHDREQGWGSAGLANAAAALLSANQAVVSPLPAPTEAEVAEFAALLEAANRLWGTGVMLS